MPSDEDSHGLMDEDSNAGAKKRFVLAFSDGFLDEDLNVAEHLVSGEDSTRLISVFGLGLLAWPRDGVPNSVDICEDSTNSTFVLTSSGPRRMLIYSFGVVSFPTSFTCCLLYTSDAADE